MKRSADCLTQPGYDFFALQESTGLLLAACDGDPRVVAVLLQLCTRQRIEVWLWLADPLTQSGRHSQLANIQWHINMLQRLVKEVPVRSLAENHDWTENRGMFRPLLWEPCPHWDKKLFFLGLYDCAYNLKTVDEVDDSDIEVQELEDGEFEGCNSLVAHEGWWGATWQPVCCCKQKALHWDFVASALVHRHNALTAFYAQNVRYLISHNSDSRHYRKFLFTGPSYQQ